MGEDVFDRIDTAEGPKMLIPTVNRNVNLEGRLPLNHLEYFGIGRASRYLRLMRCTLRLGKAKVSPIICLLGSYGAVQRMTKSWSAHVTLISSGLSETYLETRSWNDFSFSRPAAISLASNR